MKRIIRTIILLSSCLVIGCEQAKEEIREESKPAVIAENDNNTVETENETPEITSPNVVSSDDLKIEETLPVHKEVEILKKVLKAGMSQEEVKKLLGDKTAEVPSGFVENLLWRYDFPTSEDYTFNVTHIDAIDADGLNNGDLSHQLFIFWDENNKLDNYIVYYLYNGTIVEERVK